MPKLKVANADYLNVSVTDAPALVMVGHWGLSFQVEPKGSAPFTVLVEDKAEG